MDVFNALICNNINSLIYVSTTTNNSCLFLIQMIYNCNINRYDFILEIYYHIIYFFLYYCVSYDPI